MIYKITTDKPYKVFTSEGFYVREISEYDNLIYFAETEEEAKLRFKNEIFVKRFPKSFSIENITPPSDNQVHTIRGNESMVYIVLDGKQVMSWYDGANCDWPEDLTWDREISAVFDMGIKIGRSMND